MSDEGEKTCPLCAEEMDFTDQQLKPCKCGYEICVWCWHHIMEMAEKDDAGGRCPACRMLYDKEKIVGTTANCERVLAEQSMERKKSQKSKSKTTEGRKQLTSVRVIQRNLVYIVGLPLNLADEDLLQRKEYFHQYGKVLKVSISRTSAGTIQQYANNTCSVYITYAKEEEAVRCIQSVHGFILDGRPLRACFGTTKYCHAWLRNVPCTNPDCLYLHEIGSQEDSFTKDEIISAYTRVQQITGVTLNMQRRAGTSLPPPADEYCNNGPAVCGKSVAKGIVTTPVSSISSTRGSPPTSSSGRSGALPPAASWASRASNCQSQGSLASSNGPPKLKPDTATGSLAFTTAVTGVAPASTVTNDGVKKLIPSDESIGRHNKTKFEVIEEGKHPDGVKIGASVPEISTSAVGAPSTTVSRSQAPSAPLNEHYSTDIRKNIDNICSAGRPSDVSCLENDLGTASDMKCQNQSSRPLLGIDMQQDYDRFKVEQSNASSQFLQPTEADKAVEQSASTRASAAGASTKSEISRDAHELRSELETPGLQNLSSQLEYDFDDQRYKDEVVVRQPAVGNTSHSLHLLNHSRNPLPQMQSSDGDGMFNYNVHHPSVNRRPNEELVARASGVSVSSNGYLDNSLSSSAGVGGSGMFSSGGIGNQMRRYSEVNNVDSNPTLDVESSIISNILSLDLDSWDDSLTSPQNLAKLLGEADKQPGSLPSSNSWKGHNNSQSRFSFARQDEYRNQLLDAESSFSDFNQATSNHSFNQTLAGTPGNRDSFFDRLGNGFGYSYHNAEQPDNLMSQSMFSTNKLPGSRAQISAPPGFSVPSRPPPPGFSSAERNDHTFDVKSGHPLLESSSLLRNPYQASPSGNANIDADIELLDPAIIAQGRLPVGMNNHGADIRSNFASQNGAFDNESRLQMLMQRSLSSHQNLRYNDGRDSFANPSDAYGFNSRHMEHPQAAAHISPYQQFSLQQSRNPTMSNGHWDGWNEVQGSNDVGIAELLRNDRLGFNKLYGGYEDPKFQMSNSGNIYNRTFGI